MGAFKTPGLRDVSRRAPYMHDGSLKSLEEVIDFYDRGGNSNPWQSPLMRPLGLTAEEKDALLAFLHALDGSGPEDRGPRAFPPEALQGALPQCTRAGGRLEAAGKPPKCSLVRLRADVEPHTSAFKSSARRLKSLKERLTPVTGSGRVPPRR